MFVVDFGDMTMQLFPDAPSDSAPRIPRGFAVYSAASEAEQRLPVRHLVGYETFVSLCAASGAQPDALAYDLPALARFVRGHGAEITAAQMERAAATFLGNVLVQQRPDAHWVQYGEELPTAGTERQQYEVIHLLLMLMNADDATFHAFLEKIEAWVHFPE